MNWMKHIPLYFIISALVIIPGLISLARYGLRLSIEFTGGSQLTITQISQDPSLVESAFKNYSPSITTSNKDSLTLKMKTISQEEVTNTISTLKKDNPNIKTTDFVSIGPDLGAETIKKTLNALMLVSLVLILYIGYAFRQLKFGVCAVLAAFHDTAVVLGSFSLLGHFAGVEVDLLFVTAVLTMLSYSVHDTIVVFDRIRELSHFGKETNFVSLANRAVTETMARSLNNSLAIIFMLLSMFLIGGETTRYFALALLIGTITGTYSSTFNATPLLVLWNKYIEKKK